METCLKLFHEIDWQLSLHHASIDNLTRIKVWVMNDLRQFSIFFSKIGTFCYFREKSTNPLHWDKSGFLSRAGHLCTQIRKYSVFGLASKHII